MLKVKNMNPIRTWYAGRRFRSRLEARWAVWFDAMKVPWEYENLGFDVGNTHPSTGKRLSHSGQKCRVCGKNCGRPVALDLFCGAGGAAYGLRCAGFCVLGVDVNPQPRYAGCRFIQGDALAQDLTGYDFVWASPPCQGYCALKTMPNRREHPKLIPEVREMLEAWGGPWIIENVEGAKNDLRNPVMLCGSMFGLGSNGFQLRRHRYFESNLPLVAPGPCKHGPRTLGVFGAKVRDIAQEKRHYAQPKETRGKPVGVVLPQAWGFEAMGCDWMKINEASEAIPPAYSEHLGRQVMAWLAVKEGVAYADDNAAAVRQKQEGGV